MPFPSPAENARHGAPDDVRFGAIHPHEIEIHGGEPIERQTTIAHEGDGLKEDLRQQHRGPAIQVCPARKVRDKRDEVPEIPQAGRAALKAELRRNAPDAYWGGAARAVLRASTDVLN